MVKLSGPKRDFRTRSSGQSRSTRGPTGPGGSACSLNVVTPWEPSGKICRTLVLEGTSTFRFSNTLCGVLYRGPAPQRTVNEAPPPRGQMRRGFIWLPFLTAAPLHHQNLLASCASLPPIPSNQTSKSQLRPIKRSLIVGKCVG